MVWDHVARHLAIRRKSMPEFAGCQENFGCEPLDPVAVGSFGADTEMPEASDFGDLIEQLFLDHN